MRGMPAGAWWACVEKWRARPWLYRYFWGSGWIVQHERVGTTRGAVGPFNGNLETSDPREMVKYASALFRSSTASPFSTRLMPVSPLLQSGVA